MAEEIIEKEEIKHYLSNTHDIKIMNLSNCIMEEKFCDKIMKGNKK